jgi:O-Antigen ligase
MALALSVYWRACEACDLLLRHRMALFGFVLMAAYWPGIAGAATTSRWDIGIILAVVLFFRPRVSMTKAHWTGLVLLGWLFLTLAWSEGRLDGVDVALKLTLIAIAFAAGSTLTKIKPFVIGAALGLWVSSVVAIAQYCGWQLFDIQALPSFGPYPSGLFFNGDRLAAAAGTVAVAALAMRVWWVSGGLLPALVLPHCRAALLAVSVSLLVAAFQKYRHIVTFYALAVWPLLFALAVGLVMVFATASYHPDPGITQRFDLWYDTLSGVNWSGHGLGSFFNVFPLYANGFIQQAQTRPFDPHNEFLWILFEAGPIGLALALVFAVQVWRGSAGEPLRFVLVGVGVLCLFAQPFHDPTILFVALVAGHCIGAAVPVRVPAVGRGGPLRAWLPGIEGGRARGGIRAGLAAVAVERQHERA